MITDSKNSLNYTKNFSTCLTTNPSILKMPLISTEAYIDPSRRSMMELSCKKNKFLFNYNRNPPLAFHGIPSFYESKTIFSQVRKPLEIIVARNINKYINWNLRRGILLIFWKLYYSWNLLSVFTYSNKTFSLYKLIKITLLSQYQSSTNVLSNDVSVLILQTFCTH